LVIALVPSAATGTFMKTLGLATMSFFRRPNRARARRKLSRHLGVLSTP